MTSRMQAGVWAAETMLARATTPRARVDFLKNMAKGKKDRLVLVGDKIAQRLGYSGEIAFGV